MHDSACEFLTRNHRHSIKTLRNSIASESYSSLYKVIKLHAVVSGFLDVASWHSAMQPQFTACDVLLEFNCTVRAKRQDSIVSGISIAIS